MTSSIVTATRFDAIPAEATVKAQQIFEALLKQQSRAISDLLNQAVFLNSSQTIVFSYCVQRFLGISTYAQWQHVELDAATGLPSIPFMRSHCGLTEPTVSQIVKITLLPDQHATRGYISEKLGLRDEDELSRAEITVTMLGETKDGQPTCQDTVLKMSLDELLRDVAKYADDLPAFMNLSSIFRPSEGYIKL